MTVRRASPRSIIAFRILKYTSQFRIPCGLKKMKRCFPPVCEGQQTSELTVKSQQSRQHTGPPRRKRTGRQDNHGQGARITRLSTNVEGRNRTALWAFHLYRKDSTHLVNWIGRNSRFSPNAGVSLTLLSQSHGSRRISAESARPVAPASRIAWLQWRSRPTRRL